MVFDNFSRSTSQASQRVDEAKMHQMIKERAQYIWERKGRPSGLDLAIWLQAEKEIRTKYR